MILVRLFVMFSISFVTTEEYQCTWDDGLVYNEGREMCHGHSCFLCCGGNFVRLNSSMEADERCCEHIFYDNKKFHCCNDEKLYNPENETCCALRLSNSSTGSNRLLWRQNI